MSAFLLKTEPSTYSFGDLEKVKVATWDGVANPVALKNMRGIKKGDVLLIYHTGDEKQVVGLAECVKEAYPDPKGKDEKMVVIDLKAKSKLKAPVTLAVIKGEALFKEWELVKQPRLSVMGVPEKMYRRILELGEG